MGSFRSFKQARDEFLQQDRVYRFPVADRFDRDRPHAVAEEAHHVEGEAAHLLVVRLHDGLQVAAEEELHDPGERRGRRDKRAGETPQQ